MHLIPGNPFLSDKPLPPQQLENLMKKYKLDRPLIEQYIAYADSVVLHFDMGDSIKKTGQSVKEIIGRSFPYSMRLGLVAVTIAVFFGTIFGIMGSLRRNTWVDRTVMFVSTLGIAVPSFVVATVGMLIFSVLLGLLPTYGLSTPIHYILPAIALSFGPLSYIARLTRSSMLDVIHQDYIRTARAKGLREGIVIFKHALKNAILPVVTYLGPLLAGVLTGTFVIEKIFSVPGLGRAFVDSITNRDYPLILGTTIFYGAILIMMNFIVDMLYLLIDPRIKLEN
jgi:ABC-type dipeptide/oligopeptide/nickel transport system permease component